MKKSLIVAFSVLVFGSSCFSQTIYKGFEYGMSKGAAKKEFKKNKDDYASIDLGNGFIWRIFPQNFIFDDNRLVAIWMIPKGAALGLSHDNTVSYLEFTRSFFEIKNYDLFFEPDYWQYPLNFNSKYGLLMSDPDKTIMVQLYPYHYNNTLTNQSSYVPNLKVMNYDWFMSIYEENIEVLEQKSAESGF